MIYICSIFLLLPFPITRVTGGSIVGDMAPYQAFAIGGLGSVRGYGDGAVGSGRSCMVANGELTFPLVCNINTFCYLASPNVYENFNVNFLCMLQQIA